MANKTQLEKIVTELRQECKMRLKVWRTADVKNRRFIDHRQQKRYDLMEAAGCIFSVMTEKEYRLFLDRFHTKNKEPKSVQSKLEL